MFNDFVFSRLQLFQSRDEGFRQVTARQCELRSITVSTNGLDNLITRYQLATLRANICPAWQCTKPRRSSHHSSLMFNDFVFSRLQLFQSRDEGFRQLYVLKHF